MGPFGGGLLAVLIPQLRDAFHASTGAVAAGIPAYIVPFALLQLVSGTIGERLGRRRVVRTAYVVYAIASVAAALSPTIGVFLALRAAWWGSPQGTTGRRWRWRLGCTGRARRS